MSPSIYPWSQEKQRFQELSTKLAQNQRCCLNFAERHAVVLLHEARQAQHLVFRAELAFRSVTISTCLANCHQIVINLITCVGYNKWCEAFFASWHCTLEWIWVIAKTMPGRSGVRYPSIVIDLLGAVSRCISLCHVCSIHRSRKNSCHWYEQMHLFCEINMVQLIDWQTAGVWDNEQSGSAKHCWPCVQAWCHIVLERVPRWCFLQKKTLSFPNGGIETLPWPGGRSFQKVNVQMTAPWECFNPQYYP